MKTGGGSLDGPKKAVDPEEAITSGQDVGVLFYCLGDGNILREVAHAILIHDPPTNLSFSFYESCIFRRRSI
jgi:hypothetical protein